MSSNEKKKSRALRLKNRLSDSEKQNLNESSKLIVSESKPEKKIWSGEDLVKSMKPTSEEISYREEKLKENDVVHKSEKYFRCTKCMLNFNPLVENNEKIPIHPVLGVLMCQNCCDYYEDGEFSPDSEGEDKYCRWCGEGGTILGCSQCNCGFCAVCIKKHFQIEFFKEVQKDDNWMCFFCNPKPLWFLRFICSLAVQASKGDVISAQLNASNISSKDNKAHQSSSPESLATSPLPKKKIFRKRICINSSDESEHDEQENLPKKLKLTSKTMESSSNNKRIDSLESKNLSDLEELEKVLKLSEFQLNFGVNWNQKMLAKLKNPGFLSTKKNLANECRKIKWFLSLLSTYLVQFCKSLDLIEKNLHFSLDERDDGPKTSEVTERNETSYVTILQFLEFINTQIKTFMEKGIDLSDVLGAEIYDDENVIGIKKKSNSKDSISKEKNSYNFESKTNSSSVDMDETAEELKNDSESKDKSDSRLDGFESQNSEVNSTELDKEQICSNLSFEESNDLISSNPEEGIQEILAILENA